MDDIRCESCLKKDETVGGLRFNSGKAELDQVPTSLQFAAAKVLMYGEKKYSKNNWRKGMKWTIVYNCLQRHLLKWLDGEHLDDESNLPHTYHMAANVAMLIEYEQTAKSFDDRFKGVKNLHKTSFELESSKDVLYNQDKKVIDKTENGLDAKDLSEMSNEFVSRDKSLASYAEKYLVRKEKL
jgi:hypothetical protein